MKRRRDPGGRRPNRIRFPLFSHRGRRSGTQTSIEGRNAGADTDRTRPPPHSPASFSGAQSVPADAPVQTRPGGGGVPIVPGEGAALRCLVATVVIRSGEPPVSKSPAMLAATRSAASCAESRGRRASRLVAFLHRSRLPVSGKNLKIHD